ncbi:hypothetical protein BVG19_g4645 [[Candida] boidinii]|nr:hypothetical protein BVG19_g4645 [[Candida] boidinii]OWB50091.1 hypothetical protein B5S27_g1638 [[Candida] boidinii]
MPPKNNSKKGKDDQKKAEAKAKAKKAQKQAEDKTFGLRNKNKSKKVQQQINQLKGSVAENQRLEALAKRKAAEKKAAEEAKAEAAKLLQSSLPPQKVPFGVDPKSVLCELFKRGICTKGAKCKFSHDLNIDRKTMKRDLYTDNREDEKEEDTIDNWDEEKLRSVIMSKHGNPKTTTDIVCKFFIEAVENGKYGWFWVCPNGGDECKYKHSLPPGFVLKTKEQRRLEKLAADSKPKLTLEDFIETERGNLPKKNLTPITPITFAKWKKEHVLKRLNDNKKDKRILTGKEIIMKKFSDKFYEEEEISNDKGTEIDMSAFKKEIEDIDENVKDYGDGRSAFAESQFAPQENSQQIENSNTDTESKDTTATITEDVSENVPKESQESQTSRESQDPQVAPTSIEAN